MKTCSRCTECVGLEHHWLDICGPDGPDYICKHCEAMADVCTACWDGAGLANDVPKDMCDRCGGKGAFVRRHKRRSLQVSPPVSPDGASDGESAVTGRTEKQNENAERG